MGCRALLLGIFPTQGSNLPFGRVTQEAGEFMVTFPYGYHSGPRGSQVERGRWRVFTVLCVLLHIQEYLQTGRWGDLSVLYRLM